MTKRKATKPADIQFDMVGTQTAADAAAMEASLVDDLLADLHKQDSEVVEPSVAELEAAVAETIAAEPADTEVAPVKAKKEKKAKEPKEPKEAKPPRVTSITHKPGDRLLALIGGNKSLLQFSLERAEELSAEEQEKLADEFIANMNARDVIADKVKDKAIMLMTWLDSKKGIGELNEVMKRSFEVLLKDGELTSGKNGNLQTNLLSKPYSPGTAASQANQMFMLFPLLGITKREKGRMAMNDDSVILQIVKGQLAA